MLIISKAASPAGSSSLIKTINRRTARNNKAALKERRAASRMPVTTSNSQMEPKNLAAKEKPKTIRAVNKKATKKNPARRGKADRNRNRATDPAANNRAKVNKPAREPRAASRRKTLRRPRAPDPIKGRSKRGRRGDGERGRSSRQSLVIRRHLCRPKATMTAKHLSASRNIWRRAAS